MIHPIRNIGISAIAVWMSTILFTCLCTVHGLEVSCVPWLGKVDWQKEEGARYYHRTWSGKNITVKGTVLYDGSARYDWDFGDGTQQSGIIKAGEYYPHPAPIADIWHIYSGQEGDQFIATLTVKVSISGEVVEASDKYPVVIVGREEPRSNWVDRVDIEVAIEEGLWWLYSRAMGTGPYKYWGDDYTVAQTSAVIQAFELNDHKPYQDPEKNPYAFLVQRGLDYILALTEKRPITPGFDTNRNGYGLTSYFVKPAAEFTYRYPAEMYELGWAMMALASSGDPNRKAERGKFGVQDRLYKEILQDMADFCAYCQEECFPYTGGWRYRCRHCSSFPETIPYADNSATQWPILGMRAGETSPGWETRIPSTVRNRLIGWLMRSRARNSQDQNYGGFGYQESVNPDLPDDWVNIAKTAGTGITGLVFTGNGLNSDLTNKAVDYISRNWDKVSDPNPNSTNLNAGNIYAMYAVNKAFGGEFLQPEDLKIGGNRNWYRDYAEYLINHEMDGNPPDHWETMEIGVSPDFTTALSVLILTPGVLERPPIAIARAKHGGIPEEKTSEIIHVDINEPIILDASLSIPGRYGIRHYDWDVDYQGDVDEKFDVLEQISSTLELSYSEYKENPRTNPYVVRLRVTDNRSDLISEKSDLMDEDTCLIYVHEPPHIPVAVFSAKSQVCTGEVISIDGSASYDKNTGEVVGEWHWVVDGKALTCDPRTCSRIELNWDDPGFHVVKLEVRSIIEGSDPPQYTVDHISKSVSATITVTDDPAPVAVICRCHEVDGREDCIPADADKPIVVPIDTVITLSDCSYDSACDGSTTELQPLWDTNGNRQFGPGEDPAEPEGKRIELSFGEEKTIQVCLKVVGINGDDDVTCRDLRWTCNKPTPVITCDLPGCNDQTVHSICADHVISFSGEESNVCGSTSLPLSYEWDMDGDGFYEGSGKAIDGNWEDSGVKNICLKVTRQDITGVEEGRSAVACMSIMTVPCTNFLRGDLDGNGNVELTDAICLLNFLFLGVDCLNEDCMDAADVNDDGRIGNIDRKTIRRFCTYQYKQEEGHMGLVCDWLSIRDQELTGLDITDAILLLNYLFVNQNLVIPNPYPLCDKSPRWVDILGCSNSACWP